MQPEGNETYGCLGFLLAAGVTFALMSIVMVLSLAIWPI